tara:strand:+ start:505 stop:696 length:192 start_codon:yes stop_codon:yes gene_type:complete
MTGTNHTKNSNCPIREIIRATRDPANISSLDSILLWNRHIAMQAIVAIANGANSENFVSVVRY